MPRLIDAADAGFADAFTALVDEVREAASDVDGIVAGVLADVRARGDAAVFDLTERFDRIRLTPDSVRVTPAELDAALAEADPKAVAALRVAAERIRAFHARQMPADDWFVDDQGVGLGLRWSPVDAVGIYVPGGTAAYPSSVLMNAVPAQVAGVPRVVMTVPTPDGRLSPLVLAAAAIAGVREIYRVGGAQAIGALAYGTASIAPVDKIVGPGNAYVATAKRQVAGAGIVGIDSFAGPSEILVIADGQNDPAWIAADLLSQAEHDPVAQAILITDDAGFARRVEQAAEGHLAALPRAAIARESWDRFGAIIVVGSLDDTPALVARLAPEHLEIATDRPHDLAARMHNAGAIFLGRHTPEAIGDYVAGPNHVLPTARTARFSSGLSVFDFLRRTTLVECTPESVAAIGPAAVTLADAEGLDAHALSVRLRLDAR